MTRFLVSTATAALLLGLTPALAAENLDSSSKQQQLQPPTQSGISHEAAKAATEPESGSADTSGGAKEQSAAPPESGAASAKAKSSEDLAESGKVDQSSGAKEQSSAPAGSSAASTSKANPALGSGQSESSRE
ncbi:MAG TPA: hypothetical protein VIG52_08010 [Methyloceanibacter sp.]|jgi:hypothetical protein